MCAGVGVGVGVGVAVGVGVDDVAGVEMREGRAAACWDDGGDFVASDVGAGVGVGNGSWPSNCGIVTIAKPAASSPSMISSCARYS